MIGAAFMAVVTAAAVAFILAMGGGWEALAPGLTGLTSVVCCLLVWRDYHRPGDRP